MPGPESPSQRQFDLEDRTAEFGEQVLAFAKTIPNTTINTPLISQMVRSATSIGANYCEADEAGSKKEFRHRISICKKEAKETKYWLRMIASANEQSKTAARELWQEAKELHLIFAAIFRNSG
jgi:four helix bundle protein